MVIFGTRNRKSIRENITSRGGKFSNTSPASAPGGLVVQIAAPSQVNCYVVQSKSNSTNDAVEDRVVRFRKFARPECEKCDYLVGAKCLEPLTRGSCHNATFWEAMDVYNAGNDLADRNLGEQYNQAAQMFDDAATLFYAAKTAFFWALARNNAGVVRAEMWGATHAQTVIRDARRSIYEFVEIFQVMSCLEYLLVARNNLDVVSRLLGAGAYSTA